jgi:hypothetical protein
MRSVTFHAQQPGVCLVMLSAQQSLSRHNRKWSNQFSVGDAPGDVVPLRLSGLVQRHRVLAGGVCLSACDIRLALRHVHLGLC